MGANGQSGFPLPFRHRIASVFHVLLIMLSVLSTCCGVSSHISSPKYPSPVKTIQTTTSQVYSHKLRVVGVESLIPEQRRYPRHSKWPVAEALVGKGGTLGISEVFVKELDAVGWDPEPCRWLGRGWVPKPWRWLEGGWDSKRSLIRRRGLVAPETVEVVEAEWGSSRRLVWFFFFCF